MSTATSNTAPRTQVTYLAWLGGKCAKCSPRSTPAAETEQLACRRSKRCPVNSRNPASVNHSKNRPRSSVCCFGVISHAPGTASSRASTSLTALPVGVLDGVFDWPPPGLVVAIPVDGRAQAVLEFGVLRLPSELAAQRRRI